MGKTYNLSAEAVRDHLSNLYNAKKLGNEKNIEHLLNLMLTLPEHSINAMLMISIIKEEHKPLSVGCHVKYKPSEYSSSFGDRDILMDKGLMTQDGFVFGTVEMDGSWNNHDSFDPYYVNMKVKFLIWNGKEIHHYEEKVDTFSLKRIDELPEFNLTDVTDFIVIDEEEITPEKIVLKE